MEGEQAPIPASEPITNIVLVNPELAEMGGADNIQPTQPIEDSLNKEEYSKKLAVDAIKFLEEEFKEDASQGFWEIVRDAANERLGVVPVQKEEPTIDRMSEADAKKFANKTMPWGKYESKKILTVLQKDKAALESFASKPLPFQIQMRRFLASNLKKVLRQSKKKG